ncbi:MAG: LppX_LprAFG lipoprotein [Chloroflexota bacterium]|nr:LppX_LprAFG lipoprotein [Chloroflexota bacterium]
MSIACRWLAALWVGIALVGCGDDSSEPNSGTNVTPQQVLAAASKRLAETPALHFQLSVEGQTYVDPAGEIQLISAEGDLARPNKVRVQFQVELFSAGNVSIRMVTIGQESWTTDLLSGNWGPAPAEFGYDPTILFDNQDGLGPVMNRLNDPTLSGQEDINGRTSYRIDATADQASIGPLTGETMDGSPVGVTVWIDEATSDLLQVKLVEPASSGKEQPATWVLTMSDHGESVEIVPPI